MEQESNFYETCPKSLVKYCCKTRRGEKLLAIMGTKPVFLEG